MASILSTGWRQRVFCAMACTAMAATLLSTAARADEIVKIEELPVAELAPTPLDNMRGLIDSALGYIGVPYRFGGSSPSAGFDCSGLVNYVYRKTFGLVLPRTARDLATTGSPVADVAMLLPGDLVFFNTRGFLNSHVGIYLGDFKFIHAPRTGSTVRISDLRNAYFRARFNGARRIDPEGSRR